VETVGKAVKKMRKRRSKCMCLREIYSEDVKWVEVSLESESGEFWC
jgi:hypothetical protein